MRKANIRLFRPLDEDGIFLPKDGAPSSHILKFDSPRFSHLVTNELFMLRVADAAGLPVVAAQHVKFGRVTALQVERYDRVYLGGVIHRLHQEDFCQALGFPPEQKYRLAPFYDLVCTRAYDAVDRRSAMAIGKTFDYDALRKQDWWQFAADTQIGLQLVRKTAEEMATRVEDALEPTLSGLTVRGKKLEYLRSAVIPAIRRSCRRLKLSLKS